jgi:hypothetical protein
MNDSRKRDITDITNDCIGLGFYSVAAHPARIKSFYSDRIDWFAAVGCPPDKLAVVGKGFGGKQVGFARAHTRLLTSGFSDIKGISVTAMLPGGKIPAVDWWVAADLDVGIGRAKYLAFAARATVTTLEDNSLAGLVLTCVKNLKPAYGIGFHRNHDLGPSFYIGGTVYGSGLQETPASYEEGLTIGRWGTIGMLEEVYKQGIIRDVYPQNYLSAPQLSKPVGKKTLQDWIVSDSSRGTLEKLDDRMMLWKVPDRRIKPIREELWSAGVIFDWKAYLDE